MNLIEIKDLYENKENFIDKEIEVGGWVRSIRDSKTFGFIVLNDGTCFKPLQVVYSDKLDNFSEVSKTNIGAALIVKGKLVATPNAKQPFEIQADEVYVEGESTPDYPLQKKRHSFEYLRTKYIPGSFQSALTLCLRNSQIFPGAGICLCAHTTYNRKRL